MATSPSGELFRFSVDSGPGVALEVEKRLKSRFGLELTISRARLDSEIELAAAGGLLNDAEESAFDLFGLGANYHFEPARKTDVHVGLFAAMITFDDVVFLTELGRRDKLVFDDDVGFGLKIGLQRSLGQSERWATSLSLRYLRAILEGETAGQDSALDPVVLAIGVGYRF